MTKEPGQWHEKVRITAKCLQEAKQTQAGCELLQFHRPDFFRPGLRVRVIEGEDTEWGSPVASFVGFNGPGPRSSTGDQLAVCVCAQKNTYNTGTYCALFGIFGVYLWPFCMLPEFGASYICLGPRLVVIFFSYTRSQKVNKG